MNDDGSSAIVKLRDGHPLLGVMQHVEKKVMAAYNKRYSQYPCNPAVKVPEEDFHSHSIRLKTGYSVFTGDS